MCFWLLQSETHARYELWWQCRLLNQGQVSPDLKPKYLRTQYITKTIDRRICRSVTLGGLTPSYCSFGLQDKPPESRYCWCCCSGGCPLQPRQGSAAAAAALRSLAPLLLDNGKWLDKVDEAFLKQLQNVSKTLHPLYLAIYLPIHHYGGGRRVGGRVDSIMVHGEINGEIKWMKRF